eukprot:4942981-Pyramimonas_sp.AAC.1
MPTQWPCLSWSDIRGWGLWCAVVSLRGGGGATMSYRMLPCMVSSNKLPTGVGGWTSGVQ